MYVVYIIYSTSADRYYVGQCKGIQARLKRHNNGMVLSTKPYLPWELKYVEYFDSRANAIMRERFIKSRKSRSYLEKLINPNI